VWMAWIIYLLLVGLIAAAMAEPNRPYSRGLRQNLSTDANLAGRSRFPAETTVLIIDDDEEICDITELLLRKHGLDVLYALDGETGFSRFYENADRIDVVLLDMTLPGIDVRRLIHRHSPNVHIIISSGYTEQTAAEQIEDHRGLDFLQKPYSIETLLSKIGAAVLSSQRLADASSRPAPGLDNKLRGGLGSPFS